MHWRAMSILAQRILKRLDELGEGQSWLARQVGMKQQSINSIVRPPKDGKPVERPRKLREIALALKTTEEYLLGETSDPMPKMASTRLERVPGIRYIPEVDIRGGGGGGGIELSPPAGHQGRVSVSQDSVRSEWVIPSEFLRGELHVDPSRAWIVEVYGDSMYDPSVPGAPGSLFPGDRVIVDTGDKRPSPPGPFAVWDGVGLVVKMVDFVHGTDPARLRLSSRNPAYAPYEASEDEARIVGRIRGRISAL